MQPAIILEAKHPDKVPVEAPRASAHTCAIAIWRRSVDGFMAAVRESFDLCPKWIARSITLWLVLFLLHPAHADDTLAGQRYQFVAAEQALKRGDRQAFETLRRNLRDYPLYPYLLFTDLRDRVKRNPAEEIQRFLRDYEDTPLASRLERDWLNSLYREQRWQAYLDHFRGDQSMERDCNRRHALLALDRRSEALDGIEQVWAHGFSLPDSCDAVLKAWEKSGGLTTALVWQRIGLAMDEGNAGLARYLRRYLPEADRAVLEQWYALYRNPNQLREAHLRAGDKRTNEIAFNVAHRLARLEPELAAEWFDELHKRYQFDGEQQEQLQRRIALSFAYDGDPRALNWFEKMPADTADRYVRYWRIRAALAQQNWAAVLRWIDALTPSEKSEERWQYWRARALEAQGDVAAAQNLYAQVANSRSYEGFLAADRIQAPYSLDNKPLQFSASEIGRFAAKPAVQRAHELLKLDRMLDARREWYAAVKELDERQLQLAAALAHQWGWHDRAILTVSQAGYWDDLELRFPLPYLQTVKDTSKAAGVDDAWTYAVIRRESAFNSDARSHRGAMGLMQLLPSTAKHVAQAINRKLTAVADLYDADVNIKYGTAYLRMILERFGEHPVLATAAYNAGPYRVQTWLPKHEAVPADIWIETVPFNETREYLRNVLAYTAIYERRMGRDATPLQRRMPPITPKPADRRADASR